MKIGDKIKCSNGHTYTLGEERNGYTFSLIDEFGEIVNLVMDYHLHDCLISDDDDCTDLCVGVDYNDNLKYTKVLEFIEV